MNTAIISVDDMKKSLHFYKNIIGLNTSEQIECSGSDFERFWGLPKGSKAKAIFCELPTCSVGRILLFDFGEIEKKKIRPKDTPRAYGLVNLNFYTDDIQTDTDKFVKYGFKPWSQPTYYELSSSQGSPTEVVFDGPDTVAINLVELSDSDPTTRVGQMREYTRKHGRTSKGFTPVVTTSHCSKNINKSLEFFEKVLNCGVLIDEILSSPEQNKFLNLPADARTVVKFIQGNHMFGKTALSQPLNYHCHDLTQDAQAPNIGYIAQMFEVEDLDATEEICHKLNLEFVSPRDKYFFPAFGKINAMNVRNPGSGALQIIFSR